MVSRDKTKAGRSLYLEMDGSDCDRNVIKEIAKTSVFS